MTAFVLVHGAWHGGWCYKRVVRLLRQAGHEVYTPTLTGLGERAHLMNRAIDLDTHVQDIVGVIRCEELTDVAAIGLDGFRRHPPLRAEISEPLPNFAGGIRCGIKVLLRFASCRFGLPHRPSAVLSLRPHIGLSHPVV